MKIYILVVITSSEKQFGIEPLGAFSTIKKALKYVNKLHDLTPKNPNYETVYDVMEFDVDKEPSMLQWLKKEKEKHEKEVENVVISLMKKGMVDQLVGEDGNFYYTLTDLGKKSMQQGGIADNIKKFFKKDM